MAQHPDQTKTAHKPIVAVIANARGGVGKSTFAVALLETMLARDLQPGVIEIESSCRLAAYFGKDVRNIPPVSLLDAVDDAQKALEVYDCITDLTTPGDVVIDVGANEIMGFAEWAGMSLFAADVLARGHRLALIAVTTREALSVAGALDVLLGRCEAFPGAERYVVLNAIGDVTDGRQLDEAALIKQHGINSIHLPRCTSPLWRVVTAKEPLRYTDAMALSREDLERHYSMSKAMTARAQVTFAQWYAAVTAEISAKLIG